MASGVPIALALIATVIAVSLFRKWLHLRRAEFIRTYRWPPGLLERLEKCTLREEIRHPLAVHREETLQHVANIEHCFTLLDEPVDYSPCGVIEALANESKTMIKKSDDSLPDVLILAVASEAEHYEIAVYETLIANADARRGAAGVAKLLRENLAQDKHALTVARTLMKTILEQGIAVGESA